MDDDKLNPFQKFCENDTNKNKIKKVFLFTRCKKIDMKSSFADFFTILVYKIVIPIVYSVQCYKTALELDMKKVLYIF